MRLALIGQPNCGKSTVFNQVAGYKAETGNFSGTTVTYTESKVRILGNVVNLVDLPGTYTLAGTNPAEREVFLYLNSHEVDAIVNVIDASHLSQGLELTLELMELGKPLVVALNMMDEARRVGLTIQGPLLQNLLGVPVYPMIASRGRGIKDLFVGAFRNAEAGKIPGRFPFSPEIEALVVEMTASMEANGTIPVETGLAIKVIEDESGNQNGGHPAEVHRVAQDIRARLYDLRRLEPVWIFGGERHARAAEIGQKVIVIGERRITLRDRLDGLLLHPFWGYPILIAILFLFFQFIYAFGTVLESPLLDLFDSIQAQLNSTFSQSGLFLQLISGLLQGIAGGVAIVLPYLVPFLLGLGLLEDIGYLPRVAFLMDALMHRLGLHGKAVIPVILGYGCNVPAIMSTRILEDKRDRFLAAVLSTMVPCAARLSVVFGLVAFYVGPAMALLIYIFNLFVIALTGRILSRLMPEDSPGLILEMPVYRVPTLKTLFNKAWFRVLEFIVEAWPVLIIGSVVLSILTYLNWTDFFNRLVSPFSWILGLPTEVGVPLIFGILRKELSLVMLHQALGGGELRETLTYAQMIVFSVFVVFYIPCLATLMVIRKELGGRAMALIAGLTIGIATITGILARVATSWM